MSIYKTKNTEEYTNVVEASFNNGYIEYRKYLLAGQLHRIGAPSLERFDISGKVWLRQWHQYGLLHRINGPASELFYKGNLSIRQWFQDGKLHRLDGPAHESFHQSGILEIRSWYQNNLRHNIDGPAIEGFDESGRRLRVEYWLNGNKFAKTEYQRQVIILKLTAQTQDVKGVFL